MVIVQLLASPFVGGIERQLLGMAARLPDKYRTIFLSFAERGLAEPFLRLAQQQGFEAMALRYNAPQYRQAASEIAEHLRRCKADVLCCNGYKADLIGWWAARKTGSKTIAISHGWTGATTKVRLNEALDRLILRRMDMTVCVSEAQAAKVRRAGVDAKKVKVIRNAVDDDPFRAPDISYLAKLRRLFHDKRQRFIGAAGRLSPEKGFDLFVAASKRLSREYPDAGFVLFGDGPLRAALQRQITALGLENTFVLAGFHPDVRRYLPHLQMLVLPSYTEGLPVVVLEALAAGIPVVATAVGGTPEIIEDGVHGFLVSPGDAAALSQRMGDLLNDQMRGRAMGLRGRERVRQHFTFDALSHEYQEVFARLSAEPGRSAASRPILSRAH